MENNKNKRGLPRAAPPAADSAAQIAAPPPGFQSLPRFFLPSSQAATLKPPAALPPIRRALPAAADLRSPPSLFLRPPPLTSPQGAAVPSLARALPGPARPLSSPGDSTAPWRGATLSGGTGIFFFFFLSNLCLVLFPLKPEYYYILHPFFLPSSTACVFNDNFMTN